MNSLDSLELIAVFGLVAFILFGVALVALWMAHLTSRRTDDLEKQVRELAGEVARVRGTQRLQQEAPASRPAPPRPAATPTAVPAMSARPPAPIVPGVVEPQPVPPARPAAPAPAMQAPAAPAEPKPAADASGASLEERIGLTWITRLGAATVVLGAAYFFKVAIERGWLGPWGRVLLGMLAGVALVAAAERLRTRAEARYVQALIGVGLALLYVASYAAYGFYRLVPLAAAFAWLAVVALFGGALAYRHRAEAILVISLLAALANPVLLATGVDRPLALFAYLLLMTTAATAVSLACSFRWVPWLGLAGNVALFVGWYARFFHHAAPAADRFTGAIVAATAGPYWPLAARAVPLGAVAAFALQWLAFGLVLRRRGAERDATLASLLAGLFVFHGGTAALLADRPIALAVAMVAGGALAVVALWRPEERPWLAAPLIVSFLVLAMASKPGGADALPALLVAAVWLVLYLATLASAVNGPQAGTVRAILAGAMAGAAGLAALWLLPGQASGFAVAAVVVACVAVALAGVSRAMAMSGPAAAVTLAGLFGATVVGRPLGGEFLVLATVVAAIYLGSAAHAMMVRRDLSLGAVLVAVGAPVGLVAVVVSATAVSAYGLRALVSAAAGVAVFALGALVLRREPAGRNAATVLLTAGLGLVTLAVGLALSGVTITVAWSLMALAVVLAGLHERDIRFVEVGVLLFGVTLLRLAAIDMMEPVTAAERFAATLGAEGALRPPLLFNPRAIGLAAVAAALLLSARATARHREDSEELPGLAIGFAGFGYLLAIVLAVTEATAMVTHVPAVPSGLAPEAFRAAMARATAAVAAQAAPRAATATIVLGVAGGALLAAGFAAKSVLHRWAGLLVLAVTIVKLGIYDIFTLPTTLRVVVLLGIGAVLLAVGYLYARFGRKLLGMLKVAAVLALLLVPAGATAAVDPARFRSEATVTGVPAGLARFEVTPALWRASRDPASLGDLRLTEGGREVPWALRDVPAGGPAGRRSLPMFDPVVLPGGASRADFDAGGAAHDAVELTLRAPGNFLREATIAVSDDRREWGTLATAPVYRVAIGGAAASDTTVRYPASRSRWLRVTLAAVHGEPPVTIAGAASVPAGEVRVPVGTIDLGRPTRAAARGGHASVYTTPLGEGGVPLRALVAEVAGARFERRATAEGANADGVFAPAGGGVLLRAGAAENVRIPVSGSWACWRLVVDDGDDPPLEITSLHGEYRRREVVLDMPAAGDLRVLVGGDAAAAPSYDLGATLAQFHGAAPATVTLAELRPNPGFRTTAGPAAPAGWSERYRLEIGGAIALLLLGLAVTAVRLLRPSRGTT